MTERTESELAEAYEKESAALADAQGEIKEMQEHRLTLLRTTGTPEDVVSLDDEIRLESIKIEIASARVAPLKSELDMIRRERAKWSAVDMPTDDELDKLYKIVTAAHPDLNLAREQGRFDISARNHMAEFKAAFFGVGRLGRLSEPDSSRYFHAIVGNVNDILQGRRLAEVDGDAVMCAVLAWGDVVHRPADAALGQMVGVGLARIGQGTPARPMWRTILGGEANLLPSLQPRNARASSSLYPEPRVRIRYGNGREVDPAAPMGGQ